LPIVWIILTSFKTQEDAIAYPPVVMFQPSMEGYVNLFTIRSRQTPEFIASLERFIEPLILPGRINSLAQTLIKMVAPGVPDFYQGTELWDLSLVDPDNRRPVDFKIRLEMMRRLSRVRTLNAAEALMEWDSGAPKLWMMACVLAMRRERCEDCSSESKYQPLVFK